MGGHQIDCVLLIDDDFITNFLHANLLNKMQFCKNIKATENPEEALKFLETCFADKKGYKSLLILLDINMPGLDGFEFLDHLNSQTAIPIQKIDVIIVSSSIHRVDKERAERYQILDYIAKPLTSDKLKAAIERKKIKKGMISLGLKQ